MIFFNDEKIYFIDSYDNLLKCYNTSTNLFENKTLDLSTYGNALSMHLSLCGIPAYLAGTEDILENSAIEFTIFSIS